MRRLCHPYVIVLVAIAFRIALIAPFTNWLGAHGELFKGSEPGHIAAHIVRGEGFASPYTDLPVPSGQQPPLYPLFIAGIFKLFGTYSRTSLYLVMIANALAGGVGAFLIYRVGLKYFSPTVALIAAWSWSVLFPIAVTDMFVGNYSFSTLIVLSWLLLIPNLSERTLDWVLVGVATGLALLLNPMLILLVPASVVWLVGRKKYVIVMLAMIMLTIAPWYVRNYRILGHFYPGLRDNLGLELYFGNHRGMSGIYDGGGLPSRSKQLVEAGEAQFMESCMHDALAYIRSDPQSFLIRSGKRFLSFWLSPWPFLYCGIVPLAFLGLTLADRAFAWFTLIMFAVYPLAFYVTQASWASSYRHPIEPLMLLMAATPIAKIYGKTILTSNLGS